MASILCNLTLQLFSSDFSTFDSNFLSNVTASFSTFPFAFFQLSSILLQELLGIAIKFGDQVCTCILTYIKKLIFSSIVTLFATYSFRNLPVILVLSFSLSAATLFILFFYHLYFNVTMKEIHILLSL